MMGASQDAFPSVPLEPGFTAVAQALLYYSILMASGGQVVPD